MRLLILGGGTAAISAARAVAERGGNAVIVHEGLPLGGCCLNVGCVPSKYLIRAAEQVQHCHHARFPGIRPLGADIDSAALFQDMRGLIADLRRRNYEDSLPHTPGIRLLRGWGRLHDAHSIEVNGERIEGDAILIATGSRTDVEGFQHLPPERLLTNENFFAQEKLPASVIVLGGGYIAVELAQMLNRLGVRTTLLQRSAHLLSNQSPSVGETLGDFLRGEGVDLHCHSQILECVADADGVSVRATLHGTPREFRAEKLLLARGRRGNTDTLGLEALGISCDKRGFVRVDESLQSDCPGVYAAGDVLGGNMLVYTASAEAERVVERLYGGHPVEPPPEDVPWVMFSDPQVAGVGLDAEQARARGLPVEVAELPVNRWPRFSSAREHRGFLRLFRDPRSDTLVGARALCPEGGDLMSELSLILQHRIQLREVASRLVPYLTLSEGIQRCAARFPHSTP